MRVLSPQAAALHALAAPYSGSAWITLSVDPNASLVFWLKSCAYACAFFLTLALAHTRERAQLIAYTLVLSGLAQAVYGGLMHLAGTDLEIFGTRDPAQRAGERRLRQPQPPRRASSRSRWRWASA